MINKYPSLKGIYYSNPDCYEEELSNRLNNFSTRFSKLKIHPFNVKAKRRIKEKTYEIFYVPTAEIDLLKEQIFPERRMIYGSTGSNERQRGLRGAYLVGGAGRPAHQPAQRRGLARVFRGQAAAGHDHRPGHRAAVRGGGGGPGTHHGPGHHDPELRHRVPWR